MKASQILIAVLIIGAIIAVIIYFQRQSTKYHTKIKSARSLRGRTLRASGAKQTCQCRNANSNVIWNVQCASQVNGQPVSCSECCAAHERHGTFKW